MFSINKKSGKVAKQKKDSKIKKLFRPLKPVLKIFRPLKPIGGYFVGSWQELRQVRWPNRRATWGLTIAVIAFSAFFIVLIILLDALFKQLFELILK